MGELLLDADTQTSNDDILHNSIETRMPRKEWSLEISDQVAEAHIDLITRVNELEIQNHDILKNISTVCSIYYVLLSSYNSR